MGLRSIADLTIMPPIGFYLTSAWGSGEIIRPWINLVTGSASENALHTPARDTSECLAGDEGGKVVLAVPLAENCIGTRIVHLPI